MKPEFSCHNLNLSFRTCLSERGFILKLENCYEEEKTTKTSRVVHTPKGYSSYDVP